MKISVAVCDDEPRQSSRIRQLLSTYFSPSQADVDCFESAGSLLAAVETGGYTPQIAILDIKMEGMDGITLARQLNSLLPGCSIIFLSGYGEYHSAVYAAEHCFFVLKSEAEKYLPQALDKALSLLSPTAATLVTFRCNGSVLTLPLTQIIYVESRCRKLFIHTGSDIYESYGKLDEFLSESQSRSFIRCHQSFLANLHYVRGVESSGVTLTTGQELPVSRSRCSEVKTRFFEYALTPLR